MARLIFIVLTALLGCIIVAAEELLNCDGSNYYPSQVIPALTTSSSARKSTATYISDAGTPATLLACIVAQIIRSSHTLQMSQNLWMTAKALHSTRLSTSA
ncbi:hypothetical protein B0H11DRAFT_52998 [Mycena galericulata]|nr:hypothetical protein B0H11DRAFT_52998 [Mycena galericulata]